MDDETAAALLALAEKPRLKPSAVESKPTDGPVSELAVAPPQSSPKQSAGLGSGGSDPLALGVGSLKSGALLAAGDADPSAVGAVRRPSKQPDISGGGSKSPALGVGSLKSGALLAAGDADPSAVGAVRRRSKQLDVSGGGSKSLAVGVGSLKSGALLAAGDADSSAVGAVRRRSKLPDISGGGSKSLAVGVGSLKSGALLAAGDAYDGSTNEDTVKLSKRGGISYITNEISRLPTDIFMDILCRLPLKSVIICTSVHPEWCTFIKSPEFAKALLEHHVDSLAVSQIDVFGTRHQIFDIDESLGLPDNLQPTFNFETVGRMPIRGSVGGFLLFSSAAQFIVGNPLTGERVQIDFPPNILEMEHEIVTFGFGKGNDDLYKVIMISHDYMDVQPILATRCQVYTLGVGGGEWRDTQIEDGALYSDAERVAYLNGCHHWLARGEASGVYLISIFDIESETFTRRAAPVQNADMTICVLNSKLCLCDSTNENLTSIWLMQSYGEDGSWDQIYLFSTGVRMQENFMHPVKIFVDDDILIIWSDFEVIHYSVRDGLGFLAPLFAERTEYIENHFAVAHEWSFDRLV